MLKEGDKLRFGAQGASFALKRKNLVICLDSKGTSLDVLHGISKLGAHAVGRWGPECSCLIVSEDSIASSTVACAIAAGTPMVSSSWLKAALSMEGAHSKLPDFDEHPANVKFHRKGSDVAILPPEKSTESRAHLFDGMVFVWDPTELSVEHEGGIALAVAMAGGQNIPFQRDVLEGSSSKGQRLVLIEGEPDAVEHEELRQPYLIGSIRLLIQSILENRNDLFQVCKKRRSSIVHSDSETLLDEDSDPRPPATAENTPPISLPGKDRVHAQGETQAQEQPKQNVVIESLIPSSSGDKHRSQAVNYKKFRKAAQRSSDWEMVPFSEKPWSERVPGSLQYQERLLVEVKQSRQAEEMFTTDAQKGTTRGGPDKKSRR